MKLMTRRYPRSITRLGCSRYRTFEILPRVITEMFLELASEPVLHTARRHPFDFIEDTGASVSNDVIHLRLMILANSISSLTTTIFTLTVTPRYHRRVRRK